MSISPYAISIVEPVNVTDSMLISSNVPETDYSAWSSVTTYALGNRVILTSTHKIYESLQNSNTNRDPLTSPTWWIEVSPTNRWKAFDTSSTTQTIYPSNSPPNITYTIAYGQAVSTLAILNLTGANEISIVMDDPVYGIVYDSTVDVTPLPFFSSWWNWFFGKRTYEGQQIVFSDLPSYPNAEITISITGTVELAVGFIMAGQQNQFSLGMKYGANVGIQDYSRKETNDFGDTVFVERAFAKRATIEMLLDNGEVDQLQNYLASIRAIPVLWICSSEFEATTLFGFYKNFEILISYYGHSDCSINIEGLT